MDEQPTFAYNDPEKRVHYVLLFYDASDRGGSLKAFESFSPFGPIGVGDIINTKGWDFNLGGWLTVTRVMHKLSEHPGELLHETFVYGAWSPEESDI